MTATIAIIAIVVPLVLYFLVTSIEEPYRIIVLAFAGYSLFGYYIFFDLFSLFQMLVVLGIGVLMLHWTVSGSLDMDREFLVEVLVPLGIFLAFCVLSLRLASDLFIAKKYLISYAGSMLYAFIVYQFFKSPAQIKVIMVVMFAVLALNSGLGLLQLTGNKNFFLADKILHANVISDLPGESGAKPRGFYFMVFDYSKDLLFATMPLMALLIMGFKTRWRIAIAIVVLMGAAAIMTSQVRSSQIGLILGTVYIFVRAAQAAENKSGFLTKGVSLVLLFLGVTSVYVAVNPYLIQRYMFQDVSMYLRFVLASMAFAILKHHWLWGIGLGNFLAVYYDYLPALFATNSAFSAKALQPHNVFLDLWTGAGIFALIFYLIIYYCTFTALNRVRKNSKDLFLRAVSTGFQAFLIGYFVECVFHNHIFDNNYWLLIGLAYAMLSMTPRTQNS